MNSFFKKYYFATILFLMTFIIGKPITSMECDRQ